MTISIRTSSAPRDNRSGDIVYHDDIDVQVAPYAVMPPSQVIEVEDSYPAGSAARDGARVLVSQLVGRAAMPEALRLKAELIIEELVANTLAHGEPPPASAIRIRLRLDRHALSIDYADGGRAFDPTRHPSPRDSDPWHVGGFGWDIVRGLCAAVAYARVGEENTLRLELATEPPTHPATAAEPPTRA